jgi:hypothetical protein
MKETGQLRNVPHFMKAEISLLGHSSPTLDIVSGHVILTPFLYKQMWSYHSIHAQDTDVKFSFQLFLVALISHFQIDYPNKFR